MTIRHLKNLVEIVGEHNKHLGPTWAFAEVTIRVEQSANFELVDLVDEQNSSRQCGYPENFVSGFLDALGAISDPSELAIRLILSSVKHDPIKSSPLAFFEAGRDAGRKLAELLILG